MRINLIYFRVSMRFYFILLLSFSLYLILIYGNRSGKAKRSLSIDAGNGRISILTEDNTVDKATACRLRYQQTNVEVIHQQSSLHIYF